MIFVNNNAIKFMVDATKINNASVSLVQLAKIVIFL